MARKLFVLCVVLIAFGLTVCIASVIVHVGSMLLSGPPLVWSTSFWVGIGIVTLFYLVQRKKLVKMYEDGVRELNQILDR